MVKTTSLVLMLMLSSAANATVYRCQPMVKHHCKADGCATETEGFQHAEVFFFNSDSNVLGACLWTNCYTGSSSQFASADGEQTTVIGLLTPDHSPEMYGPVLVSLTMDKQLRFAAVWQYSGEALTADHGKCEPQNP